MASILTALLMVTAVGFVFSNTRKIGLIGLGAIAYLYPIQSLVAAGIGAAIYLYWRTDR
ncbi:MAG: hypothetical protein WC001_13570 [Desulfurivibrionaceae bacterium]